MKRKTPRSLNPDEEALWRRVAKTATPLADRELPVPGKVEPAKKPPNRTPAAPKLEKFEIGSKAASALPENRFAPPSSGKSSGLGINMDRKIFQKMKRGKTKPEARIDLHGMTASAAQTALTSFIFSAQASGKRLVLVITGKGKRRDEDGPIPARTGVLRHQLPHWLGTPPLNHAVLQVSEAHQRHGGAGAFYVYLRRL